jgi:NTE family protein
VGKRRRTGLVIGGGAALGGAWAVGALSALNDVEGYDPASSADLVVGTSAGSVLAALLGCGVPLDVMQHRLSGRTAEDVEGTGPVNPFAVHDHVRTALGNIPRPIPAPGNLLLAARTLGRPHRYTMMTTAAALAPRGRGSLQPVADLIAEYTGGRRWPRRPKTWIVAMDFDSGRRVAFGRSDAPVVPLVDAVLASCAAPGYFPPVPIGSRRYVDGGAVSVTNVDVVLREHLDEVLVLAPMAMFERDHPSGLFARLERRARRLWTRRLNVEVSRLAATGTKVRVFAPTAEDLYVMGGNVMDPTRRREVFETALRTMRERLTTGPAPTAPSGDAAVAG